MVIFDDFRSFKPENPPERFIQIGKAAAVAHLPIQSGAQTHCRLSVKPILRFSDLA